MSVEAIQNLLRRRAVVQARQVKAVFQPDGVLSREAEAVLADLRDFCLAQETVFNSDPLLMARAAGRREVWLRITNFLNLDESRVQLLMEVDDGL